MSGLKNPLPECLPEIAGIETVLPGWKSRSNGLGTFSGARKGLVLLPEIAGNCRNDDAVGHAAWAFDATENSGRIRQSKRFIVVVHLG